MRYNQSAIRVDLDYKPVPVRDAGGNEGRNQDRRRHAAPVPRRDSGDPVGLFSRERHSRQVRLITRPRRGWVDRTDTGAFLRGSRAGSQDHKSSIVQRPMQSRLDAAHMPQDKTTSRSSPLRGCGHESALKHVHREQGMNIHKNL